MSTSLFTPRILSFQTWDIESLSKEPLYKMFFEQIYFKWRINWYYLYKNKRIPDSFVEYPQQQNHPEQKPNFSENLAKKGYTEQMLETRTNRSETIKSLNSAYIWFLFSKLSHFLRSWGDYKRQTKSQNLTARCTRVASIPHGDKIQ